MNLLANAIAGTPRLRATEALEHHLQCAGLRAHSMATLDENGLFAILFVGEPYARALNALEHAGLDARLVSESKSDLIDVRVYESTVNSQTISIVMQPPAPPLDAIAPQPYRGG